MLMAQTNTLHISMDYANGFRLFGHHIGFWCVSRPALLRQPRSCYSMTLYVRVPPCHRVKI